MEFKQLQSYVAVVKYGSFTKAAERLFVSQPTVSLHISMLEEELHRELIIRTTKSIEITEKGWEVYEHAQHILEMRERMIKSCREESKRIIYVGASTIPAAYILPEILPKFDKEAQGVYFAIEQSDSQGVVDGLMEGRFDIGFIGMKQEDKLICEPFCEDRMVLVTPVVERFLEMHEKGQISLKQLLEEPIILREKGSGSGKHAANFIEKMGMTENQLHVAARINDQETTKRLVAGGLGISIISEMAARNFVEEKRILQFELPSDNRRQLYLVYRKDEPMKPHVKEFTEFIHQKYM